MFSSILQFEKLFNRPDIHNVSNGKVHNSLLCSTFLLEGEQLHYNYEHAFSFITFVPLLASI